MKTVVLAYAFVDGIKTLIGVNESIDKGVQMVKNSGFGYGLTESQLRLFAILHQTVNLEVNFKLETWQVN